jgi:hypothetical protein
MSRNKILYVCVGSTSSSHEAYSVNGATYENPRFVGTDDVGVGMQAMSRLIANRTILGIRKYDGGKAVILSTLPSYLA